MKLLLKPQAPDVIEALEIVFIADHHEHAEGKKPSRHLKHVFSIPRKRACPELVRESLAGKVEDLLHLMDQTEFQTGIDTTRQITNCASPSMWLSVCRLYAIYASLYKRLFVLNLHTPSTDLRLERSDK